MNAYIIRNGATTFKRISKRTARKLWGAASGQSIALCPVKLRPGYPWAPHLTIFAQEQAQRAFDEMVGSFEHYNCTGNETGTYTAFYIIQ